MRRARRSQPAVRSRVVLVAFPGVQTLDVTGPAEVFAIASRLTGGRPYSVVFASRRGGMLETSSGLEIRTVRLDRLRPGPRDSVLVAGGAEGPLSRALQDEQLLAWLARARYRAGRLGSVCSGAFVLAQLGALDGKRAATHWDACDRLARFRPAVRVDRNAIFVREGRIWTSAGVTTGIDMALAMVEDDLGKDVADRIAARLVLYARRPGFQSQWSEALVAQVEQADPMAPAIAWARAHLRELDVTSLARASGLSPRTLHRRCVERLRTTPAKLIERLRVEHARTLLSTTERAVKAIAIDAGFGSDDRMRRAFERELGVAPTQWRESFAR